ncbi:MAG: 30S ribosome-binding factor RbfA [Planctomycetes bacterium]|nr:30S ribosome-binding factor RbfA [Planctomycetota bacterium]
MKSFRTHKMASLIRDIASDMIANKVQDPRISRFASVTRVEVAPDLQMAKVYISVLGSDEVQRSTMRGLHSARGLIQRAVAQGVTARTCPQLAFVADGSIKKAAEIMEIINANAAEMEERAEKLAEEGERCGENPAQTNESDTTESDQDDGVQP